MSLLISLATTSLPLLLELWEIMRNSLIVCEHVVVFERYELIIGISTTFLSPHSITLARSGNNTHHSNLDVHKFGVFVTSLSSALKILVSFDNSFSSISSFSRRAFLIFRTDRHY